MPIHQERVIALINAGLDYQQSLLTTTKAIREAHARVTGLKSDAANELSLLAQMFANPALTLNAPGTSEATIAIEAAYFRRNAKRNESAKRYQRKRRHGDENTVLTPNPPSPIGFGQRNETEEEKLLREYGVSPQRAEAVRAKHEANLALQAEDQDEDDNDILPGQDVGIEE